MPRASSGPLEQLQAPLDWASMLEKAKHLTLLESAEARREL